MMWSFMMYNLWPEILYGVEVQTNGKEGWWSDIKAELKRMRGTYEQMLPHHLDEIMYRQHCRAQGDGGIFECLTSDSSHYYPAPTEIQ